MKKNGLTKDVVIPIERIKNYFKMQKDEILATNLLVYERLSVCAAIAIILYILITEIMFGQRDVSFLDILLLALVILHCFASSHINKHRLKNKNLERFACVNFALCIYFMLIMNDTIFAPHSGQIFSAVFLVIAPTVFIMTASRMMVDQIFFVVAYGYFAFKFKDTAVAVNDMYSIWAGFFFGVISYLIVMELRVKVNMQVSEYKYNSETDELTKIDNRRAAKEQIEYLLKEQKEKTICALMILDIDYFKQINDTYGHEMGDVVLEEVAQVLKNAFRETDVVARYGGDEFLVFLTGFREHDFLYKKCKEIETNVKAIHHKDMKVSCSIGMCISTDGKCEMEDMLHVADKALYVTKERERGTETIYFMKEEDIQK